MSGADDQGTRGQSRLQDFKNVNKGKDEWRQRRNTSSSELRQSKRDHQISKRREMIHHDETDTSTVSGASLAQLDVYISQTISSDPAEIFEGVNKIRTLMCVKEDPPLKQVVATGVHWKLVEYLEAFENPNLQFEAAWALTNIVSGDREDTKAVAEANAIPALVQLLKSPVGKVRAQAVWALGNMAGDNVEYRDLVLKEGVMGLLLKLLWDAIYSLDNKRDSADHRQEHEMLQTGTWSISNFVRGEKSGPNYYEMIEGSVEFLARIINFSEDLPTLADACWALSYLTDCPDSTRIQIVVEAHVTGRLVKLMQYQQTTVVSPALRTIGNILTGDDIQTNVVLQSNALDALDALLEDKNDLIRKESAWAMSNVFAGTKPQIRKALEEVADAQGNMVPRYKIVPKLLAMMMKDTNAKARKEAAWAITNLITMGTPENMQSVIYDYDGLQAMMTFLKLDVLTMGQLRTQGRNKSFETMETLAHNILHTLLTRVLPAGANMGYPYNIYSQRITEISETDVFEQLAMQPAPPPSKLKNNMSIRELAANILQTFFADASGQAQEYVNNNEGVNAQGQMEFNPNLQGGGITL